MRKMLLALTAIAVLTAPAYSQFKGGRGGKRSQSDQATTDQKKKKTDAAERDYKAAVDRLPDKPYDPWHNMR